MARKVKPNDGQLSLLSTAAIEPHSIEAKEVQVEPHSIEAKEVQEIEQRSAPDNHPALVEFRNRVLDEHCRKYPDGLCAYFRYEFRVEDH